MLELSLHILDIAENSIRARARRVVIAMTEDGEADRLTLEVRDDGKGMTGEERKRALDPFYTTKKVRRVGLGLPMLAQAAANTGGSLEIESNPEAGTTVRVVFGLRHIDRQPRGQSLHWWLEIRTSASSTAINATVGSTRWTRMKSRGK